ncbi:hypothetical protein C8R45DRAFT_1011777 [Mycena sanguinolenta]|nr:hypothetical protein C8R45DRAFT_1011777 [Mycena sanguinolenta]
MRRGACRPLALPSRLPSREACIALAIAIFSSSAFCQEPEGSTVDSYPSVNQDLPLEDRIRLKSYGIYTSTPKPTTNLGPVGPARSAASD